jgi:anaerobic selenocysteine-containing dehydrogenase
MKVGNTGQKTVQTLCRMCDDRCGINVHFDDGGIIDIDGFEPHPWNKGRLCVKGRAAVDMIYAPDRILEPMKKTEKGWQKIGLAQALDEITTKLHTIVEKDGARSIGVWKGEALGFAQQEGLARRFCHAIGTPNYFSNDSACFAGRYIGYSLVMGTLPVPDYANSDCIVLWGGNPPHAHPNMTRMIMEAKHRGAKLIVIDPRLSAIARKADLFLQIRPGTDGALALGIMRRLIENKWYDQEFVDGFSIGFDSFARYTKKFTPQYVETETGIDGKMLDAATSIIARNRPRVANYVGNGLEHHENGVNNIRTVACLDGLLGSLDHKGGNLIPYSAGLRKLPLYEEVPLKHLDPIGADIYPVLYDFRQECHTMTAMDTIMSGKPYPLRAMFIAGANPCLTNPNSGKVLRALQNLDLLVVRDLFMTETAELADYFLPAASFLERTELHVHSVYQTINLTSKLLSYPSCQDEYQFWHDLAQRLGAGSYFPWDDETVLNRWLLQPTGISLEELRSHPEGYRYKPIHYGKWREMPLSTPSQKFEFTSAYLKKKGYPELPEYRSPGYLIDRNKQYPYTLITGARKLLYYHSRNHNFPRFHKSISGPEMEIHPSDAKSLGITDGEVMIVTSEIGSLEIRANVVENKEIIPGFLQTPDAKNDPISGFPLLKAIPVRIGVMK